MGLMPLIDDLFLSFRVKRNLLSIRLMNAVLFCLLRFLIIFGETFNFKGYQLSMSWNFAVLIVGLLAVLPKTYYYIIQVISPPYSR